MNSQREVVIDSGASRDGWAKDGDQRARSPERLVEHRPSWLNWAARVGYAACGVVYLAIGAIAAAVALGFAERPGDADRVMRLIGSLPFGRLVLVALSLGLLGYAALNMVGAFRDQEQRGRSLAGLVLRAADALTGALYLALAVGAVRIAAAPGAEGARMAEMWAAGVLRLPGGAMLLGAVGLALIGAGGYLVYRARAEPFHKVLDRRALSGITWRLIAGAARFGTLARAVVFCVCGLLVVEAAITREPDGVGDIGDALSAIATTPLGTVALAIVALGFMAYGAYQLAKVRYRRVPIR